MFDFQKELSELRELCDDSIAQEEKGKEILQKYFDSIEDPERQLRMKQIQWKIDGEMRKYKNPITRMNKMGEMMYTSFFKLRDELQKLV